MSEGRTAESGAPCPSGCADLVTGEPYLLRPSNPDYPDDGLICPSCWGSVTPSEANR